MENDQKQRNKKEKEIKVAQEEVEDATEYGEFVCSYFAWKTLEEQKEIEKKLEKITQPKKENDII